MPSLNPTEKQIQNSILVMLRYYKIFAWQNDSVGIFDKQKGVYRKRSGSFYIKGVSDILGVLPDGKALAIEVKTPQRKKQLTLEQVMFLKHINENNGVGFVATSMIEAKEFLSNLNYINRSF